MTPNEIGIKILKQIRDSDNTKTNEGICILYSNLVCEFVYQNPKYLIHESLLINIFVDSMKAACINWEHYSGSKVFPIVGGSEAYHNKPLWDGEYGQKRLELLDRIINVYENDYEYYECKPSLFKRLLGRFKQWIS